jgi:serine/threonine protein kinase
MSYIIKIKQFNKNFEEEKNIKKKSIKKEILKIQKIKKERQSTRLTTGILGRLINKKFGTGKRFNIINSMVPNKHLFTYINNSNIRQESKLILNTKIVGEGSFGKVYKLKVNDNKELIYKSIIGNEYYGKNEYKALKFHYLLQKFLESNKKDSLKYLCRLYEYGFINKIDDYTNIYAIMDNCGIELKEFIISLKKNNLLTLHKIIEIMIQCARALQVLHDIKYCHLDIKPQNFLVFFSGNDIQIKIIDFGFITKIDNINFVLSLLKYKYSRESIGTLKYMIPKMVYNYYHKKFTKLFRINESIDIFSLGCMFYEFLIILKKPYPSNIYDNLFVCPLNGNLEKRANYKIYFENDIIKLKQIFNNKQNTIIDIIHKMVNPHTKEREKYKVTDLISELEKVIISLPVNYL